MKKFFPLFAISTTLLFIGCSSDDSNAISADSEIVAPSSSNSAPTSSSATAKSSATETSSAATTSSASTPSSDWLDYCLEVINNYRATENLAPLTLAEENKQDCTEKQTAEDLSSGQAHGHFGDCDEFAQNSGPNINLSWYKTEKEIVDTYLKMMWDEKKLVESGERDPEKDEDYSYIGHYLNMSNKKFTSVACAIAKSSDGTTGWFNVNFF